MSIKEIVMNAVHGQPLVAAVLLFVGSVAVLIAAAIWTFAAPDTRAGVLGDYAEAMIHSTVVGVDGPATEERGPLIVAQERCVNGDQIIQVEVSISARRLEADEKVVPILTRAKQARAAGCNLSITTYALPPGVTPGMWRLEGISRAVNTSELRYWASEPFIVVAAK